VWDVSWQNLLKFEKLIKNLFFKVSFFNKNLPVCQKTSDEEWRRLYAEFKDDRNREFSGKQFCT